MFSRRSRHKTLVFHIGDHKTGSTAIQSAFAQRQVTLKGLSVFYPAKLAHNYLRQHFQAYADPDTPAARQAAIATFKKLAAQIRASDADFCLISTEELERVDPGVFQDIMTTYFADTADEIRIIAYVRPHGARMLSSFVERSKLGVARIMNGTLETFFKATLDNKNFLYEPRFSRWRDLFGDQFTLRPMIRNQLHNGSVVDDIILQAFGVSDFQIKGSGTTNESLVLEDLMRLKVLQTCLLKYSYHPRYRHTIGWEFSRILNALPPPETRTKLQLHKSLATRVHSAYLQDARAMDRAFFDDKARLETELGAMRDGAVQAAQSFDPKDYLPAPELRSLTILSEIISGMLQNEGQKWPKFLHEKRIKDAEGAAEVTAD